MFIARYSPAEHSSVSLKPTLFCSQFTGSTAAPARPDGSAASAAPTGHHPDRIAPSPLSLLSLSLACALPLLPLQEFAEQRLALLRGVGGGGLGPQEGGECPGRRRRIRDGVLTDLAQHLLGGSSAGPARDRRRK